LENPHHLLWLAWHKEQPNTRRAPDQLKRETKVLQFTYAITMRKKVSAPLLGQRESRDTNTRGRRKSARISKRETKITKPAFRRRQRLEDPYKGSTRAAARSDSFRECAICAHFKGMYVHHLTPLPFPQLTPPKTAFSKRRGSIRLRSRPQRMQRMHNPPHHTPTPHPRLLGPSRLHRMQIPSLQRRNI